MALQSLPGSAGSSVFPLDKSLSWMPPQVERGTGGKKLSHRLKPDGAADVSPLSFQYLKDTLKAGLKVPMWQA
jgi:hypothetical protein